MIRAEPGFLAPDVRHRPMAWAWPVTVWWTLGLLIGGALLWATLGREGGWSGLLVGLLFLLPVGIGAFLLSQAAARRTIANLVCANARREGMHFIRTFRQRVEVHTPQGRYVWRQSDLDVEATDDGWRLSTPWWSATCSRSAMDDGDRRRLMAWQGGAQSPSGRGG